MKKLLSLPAILLMGLVSCNSGSNETTPATDSTDATTTVDSTVHTDTSHAAMSMASGDSLPAIPAGAKVSFKNLKDGQTVSSPLKVEMVATKIDVDSTAKGIKAGSGHFHILIDAGDSTNSGVVVLKDSAHLHYGNAQKEATLTLTPGKHRLALQFADGIHRSYGSKLASAVTVDVKK